MFGGVGDTDTRGGVVGGSPEEWMTRLRFCMTSMRAPTSPPALGLGLLQLSGASGVWGGRGGGQVRVAPRGLPVLW